jgi:hypothetical protein
VNGPGFDVPACSLPSPFVRGLVAAVVVGLVFVCVGGAAWHRARHAQVELRGHVVAWTVDGPRLHGAERWSPPGRTAGGTLASRCRVRCSRPRQDRSPGRCPLGAHVPAEPAAAGEEGLGGCRTPCAGPSGLPSASPDFWERAEETTTLGTASPLLAGLHAATHLWRADGRTDRAIECAAAAAKLQRAIDKTFGSDGYPRCVGGDDADAAVTFLLPPFLDSPSHDVLTAWEQARSDLYRPAGGLAPGAGWSNDGCRGRRPPPCSR